MQLIDRTLETLILLSTEPDGLSVTQIAEKLDISSSSIHRILQSLKKHHFVLQSTETKRYRLGYKVLSLTTNITKKNNFTLAARPYLEKLAEETNETIALCILEGESVVCLDYVESKNTNKLMVNPGVAMPAHATSSGKAILAYRQVTDIKHVYMHNQDNQVTENTLNSYNDFIDELNKVREDGYAISDEELQIGVQGIACPIFDFNQKAIGSISITALKSDDVINDNNMELLKKYSSEITKSIGG